MLSQSQRATLQRARSLGTGEQGVALTDEECVALLAITLADLGHEDAVPNPARSLPRFFQAHPANSLRVEGIGLESFYETALAADPDVDTYFGCLARLHKGRKKYERIVATQPLATMDQVGPRALLQFGSLPDRELAALLVWRKWLFDLDNRAAQETGYLFEPIIASAIGGVPASPRSSPVKRHADGTKGRQVDCIRDTDAYEFKIRVTIAASGQGRWQEEIDFAVDCRSSGFRPVLVVLDPTPNPRLRDLKAAFTQAGGIAYIGNEAWDHLESVAGASMAIFLENYVRKPLDGLLRDAPAELPDLHLTLTAEAVIFRIGSVELGSPRLDSHQGPPADE
jgi:hypothetical protein